MKRLENLFESLLFSARWLLAPFFFGLVLAIGVLFLKFGKELLSLFAMVFLGAEGHPILSILTLVDTALLASLLLIIAFSGYENFVSKFGPEDHEDRPAWMGSVGFSDLKLKLIGAIVAISTVELLKTFLDAENTNPDTMAWKVGIHLTFVTSGVLFALTDFIAGKSKAAKK